MKQSNQLNSKCAGNWDNPTAACSQELTRMSNEIGNVNIYNILEPCINGGLAQQSAELMTYNNASVLFRRSVLLLMKSCRTLCGCMRLVSSHLSMWAFFYPAWPLTR